jgi:ABC-type lipoprotein release transport system permease subunit
MMAWVEGRYAARSVRRNLRRTALSVAGIGVGVALALFMESVNRGREGLFARAAAYSGAGHLRVVPEGWRQRRDPRLRLRDWRADLQAARALPGALAVAPRARAQALLAMGTHVLAVEMVGVDAEAEPRAYRFVRTMAQGRWLEPGETGAVVLGRAAAERLHAELGDEVLSTAVGSGGGIESAMFRIVGLVATGSEDLDASICQLTLEGLGQLAGASAAGEVTIILADHRTAAAAKAVLAPGVAPGDEVMTFEDITPEFKGHMDQDAATSRFVNGVILLIVLLGVASAQLAAVLERRREFAVLSALGMSGWRMVRLVMLEALGLGAGGAALGVGLGLPVVWHFARRGLDFSKLMGADYAFQGLLIEPVIYADLGAWIVPFVAAVAFGATALASLYPAWFAARTDPAVALRVAQ